MTSYQHAQLDIWCRPRSHPQERCRQTARDKGRAGIPGGFLVCFHRHQSSSHRRITHNYPRSCYGSRRKYLVRNRKGNVNINLLKFFRFTDRFPGHIRWSDRCSCKVRKGRTLRRSVGPVYTQGHTFQKSVLSIHQNHIAQPSRR